MYFLTEFQRLIDDIIAAKTFYRLGYPYGECRETWKNEDFPVYSRFGATQECLEDFSRRHCNCTYGRLYIPKDFGIFCNNKSAPPNIIWCWNRKHTKFNQECKQQMLPCSDTQFNIMSFQTEWPEIGTVHTLINRLILNYNKSTSTVYFTPENLADGKIEVFTSVPLLNLLNILQFDKKEKTNILGIKSYLDNIFYGIRGNESDIRNREQVKEMIYKWVKSTFCKIYIKFEHNQIVVNRQKPQFGRSDLLASIGGSLGLWIGWSALTLVEFISLFMQFCNCPLFNDAKKIVTRSPEK